MKTKRILIEKPLMNDCDKLFCKLISLSISLIQKKYVILLVF